ncbi:alpha beta-hydrolase [Fusarium phyllophilum]|uniref:Alpha beta-hydrolase n=1 Tax=Fusarium phyllophilum TaxID=47803 RepID=A0A8H5NAH5_9HYPO|nr:alpha beta-hydrolase [Fusarium phyllophilum]
MAAPGGKYHIHDQLDVKEPHHESFAHLWKTRWEPLADNMTYPFLYTDKRDFKEIAEEMIRRDFKEPYEWNAFASMFDPHASNLYEKAEAAEMAGELEKASEYYLRAANLWFISRYPAIMNDIQRNAWERSKVSVLKGLRLRGINMQEVLVPHKHGLECEGKHIPVWICLPEGASKENPVPLVFGMGGLDSWRPEMSCFAGVFQACGLGMVIAEIPGTGDSPALADDPKSPDRQWSSVLDWIEQNEAIDSNKVVGWGISTGGYYATRAAYMHHDRFLGLVSHGGATHYAFDSKWLENIDYRDNIDSASEAFSWKWGFRGDTERFIVETSDRFSLLKDGTLDRAECARLLLVNGTDDSIFPIDDLYLCLEHGPPKEARVFRGKGHMGGKASYSTIISWISKLAGSKVDVQTAIRSLDFRPKH